MHRRAAGPLLRKYLQDYPALRDLLCVVIDLEELFCGERDVCVKRHTTHTHTHTYLDVISPIQQGAPCFKRDETHKSKKEKSIFRRAQTRLLPIPLAYINGLPPPPFHHLHLLVQMEKTSTPQSLLPPSETVQRTLYFTRFALLQQRHRHYGHAFFGWAFWRHP